MKIVVVEKMVTYGFGESIKWFGKNFIQETNLSSTFFKCSKFQHAFLAFPLTHASRLSPLSFLWFVNLRILSVSLSLL